MTPIHYNYTRMQKFLVKNRFDSPKIFLIVGTILSASGLLVTKSRSPFLGAAVSLAGFVSFYTGNQVAEVHNFISFSQDRIDFYEENGNYSTALKIAKYAYENAIPEHSCLFFEKINDLEKNLLSIGYSRLLFDQDRKPRVLFLKLLKELGMETENATVSTINHWAQNNLLRKGERWEVQDNKFEKIRDQIIPLLTELGFTNQTSAHLKDYQGALIHGGLLQRVRLRLSYLIKQWQEGARFSHIYFLSGERPLEPTEQIINTPPPKTECEMCKLVWEQSEIPQEMKNGVRVHFVNAPMKTGNQRPTTDDTIREWLKSNPSLGNYLVISNSPYKNRQDLVIRTIAPKTYGFDTIGEEADNRIKVALILDELGRYIYQFHQLYPDS